MIIPFRRIYGLLQGGHMATTIAFPSCEGREGGSVAEHRLTKVFHCVLPGLKVRNGSIGW